MLSPFFSIGLKSHAKIVSISLISLTLLLGVRAYRVAEQHFNETQALVVHDLEAQAALLKLENLWKERKQAQQKFKITKDPLYQKLSEQKEADLFYAKQVLMEALSSIDTHLLSNVSELPTLSDIAIIRDTLQNRRETQLHQARKDALGILRIIAAALVLTVVITLWILILFYRGILNPIERLKLATDRIKTGEFKHRVDDLPRVSELRELTQSFNSMARRLESLDRAKSEFLATVSHEIKNPLAALKEGLGFLANHGHQIQAQDRTKGFAACLIATKRLETMINNLLKLSKNDSNPRLYEFDFSEKDLTEAAQTALDEIRPLASKKSMALQLHSNPNLTVSFNWDGMVQVFENLLINAIKYGNEQSTVEVHLKSEGQSKEIHVEVINQGKAIAPGDAERIFDRFYRGTDSKSQQGLGIGLHVVKQIIQAHRGDISARSEHGKTRFHFWFPNAILLAIVLSTANCASLIPAKTPSKVIHRSPRKNSIIALDGEYRSWGELEKDISPLDSDQVQISVSTLKSLLRTEKSRSERCQNISDQLKALKDVDLDSKEGETSRE